MYKKKIHKTLFDLNFGINAFFWVVDNGNFSKLHSFQHLAVQKYNLGILSFWLCVNGWNLGISAISSLPALSHNGPIYFASWTVLVLRYVTANIVTETCSSKVVCRRNIYVYFFHRWLWNSYYVSSILLHFISISSCSQMAGFCDWIKQQFYIY